MNKAITIKPSMVDVQIYQQIQQIKGGGLSKGIEPYYQEKYERNFKK